ncbi:hypothetical protein COV93_06705 [Candidatus Woesearchaeota archaeon CG11_big_fil_rev_8_21_14_0_20_43_8]|nr:MAG: hypothetical protein COV93_06705 [Candidatus Woesearchaeota archaeon CG11_big_fil_rev_8_21_14_0_20_43_8]
MAEQMIRFCGGHIGLTPELEEIAKEAICKASERVDLYSQYGMIQGLPELRETIIEKMGFDVSIENILITSSSQQALSLAFDSVKTRTKWIQEPAYFGAIRLLKGLDTRYTAKFHYKESPDFKNHIWPPFVCPSHPERHNLVYLTSNFHNPSGFSYAEEQKDDIAEMMDHDDNILIEDNPYDLLHYDNKMPNRIFDRIPDRTIFVGSLSKITLPGLRIGYIMAKKDIIRKIRSEKITADLFTSTLNQIVAKELLVHERYLDLLKKEFKERRDTCVASLDNLHLSMYGVEYTKPEGGIFLMLTLPADVDQMEFFSYAKHVGVELEQDSFSHHDGKSRNNIRMNFAANDPETIRLGIENLKYAFGRLIWRQKGVTL